MPKNKHPYKLPSIITLPSGQPRPTSITIDASLAPFDQHAYF